MRASTSNNYYLAESTGLWSQEQQEQIGFLCRQASLSFPDHDLTIQEARDFASALRTRIFSKARDRIYKNKL
jgi:hypothetical protein